ncbi:hypothetical protein U1Q18_050971 [Sarracenia purpurea var. burkii]
MSMSMSGSGVKCCRFWLPISRPKLVQYFGRTAVRRSGLGYDALMAKRVGVDEPRAVGSYLIMHSLTGGGSAGGTGDLSGFLSRRGGVLPVPPPPPHPPADFNPYTRIAYMEHLYSSLATPTSTSLHGMLFFMYSVMRLYLESCVCDIACELFQYTKKVLKKRFDGKYFLRK